MALNTLNPPDKPNVIFVFCDDLGYGDLGCYGSERNRTPRLDQMAREGMLFSDFYSTSSLCSPSRAALMTGCYPRRAGLVSGSHHGALLLPVRAVAASARCCCRCALLLPRLRVRLSRLFQGKRCPIC